MCLHKAISFRGLCGGARVAVREAGTFIEADGSPPTLSVEVPPALPE